MADSAGGGGGRAAAGGRHEQGGRAAAGRREKSPKTRTGRTQSDPPPPKSKVVSILGAGAQNGYIAPALLLSDIPKTVSHLFANFETNIKAMNNSIYNSKYNGLTVRNGRLVNEQLGKGVAGITQAAMERKAMKEQRKIGMMEEAYVRADMKVEAIEAMKDMMK